MSSVSAVESLGKFLNFIETQGRRSGTKSKNIGFKGVMAGCPGRCRGCKTAADSPSEKISERAISRGRRKITNN